MPGRDDIFYRAVLARDYRFDGKFFVGVKTTGVYCRPICPARPKRNNVEFFASAASAERAGYRPCLRCRPESAPASPAWVGTSAVVRRALRQIASRAGDAPLREEEFAQTFGMSARHLRRLFERELGRTPKQIADAMRLDFARKLVVESTLPMTEIAYTAGFRSLRRFNDAMQQRFRRSPTKMRGAGARGPLLRGHGTLVVAQRDGAHSRGIRLRHVSGDDFPAGIRLSLAYRPPFDWNALLVFLDAHRIEGLESCSDGRYERIFLFEGKSGIARVTKPAHNTAAERCASRIARRKAGDGKPELQLEIVTQDARCLFPVAQKIRRMFDLDSDPVLVANALAACPALSKLVIKRPGLRIPGCWDAFELAVCAIIGQVVSLTRARALVAQLIAQHGSPGMHPLTGERLRHFPAPGRLAGARLTGISMPESKRVALITLARRLAAGELSLDPAQDPEELKAHLQEIPGIGPWTAEYIALRAIGDADAYPAQDLILRRASALHPDMQLKAVRPWRGYAAVHLWREHAPA